MLSAVSARTNAPASETLESPIAEIGNGTESAGTEQAVPSTPNTSPHWDPGVILPSAPGSWKSPRDVMNEPLAPPVALDVN